MVYVFAVEEALGEDFGLEVPSQRQVWDAGLDTVEAEVLAAMRHMRNTAAHGYMGGRAAKGYAEFDRRAEPHLRSFWKRRSSTHIILNSTAGFHAAGQLHGLAQQAIHVLTSG